MKLSSAAVAVASLAGFAAAQNNTSSSYGAGLVAALNGAGLTVLATLVQSQADLASQLQTGGNYTIFAPSNTAISNFLTSLNGAVPNATTIQSILRYHVLPGTIAKSSLNATHTVAGSLLNEPLLGGPAAVTLYNSTAGPVVLTAGGNIPIGAGLTYQNLQGYVVDMILPVPVDAARTIALANLTTLATVFQQVNPQALTLLASTPKLTIFAPNNAAFAAINSTISTLSAAQIQNALLNHLINGTVVYSTNITNTTTAQSAHGQTLRFMIMNGSAYVQSGNSTPARIIRPDIPASNAVVHVIENVLANVN